MAVQTSLGVQCALVGNLQLVHGVVVNLQDCLLATLRLGDGGCQHAERQSHEDAVEPYLIGVDGFVPEHLVGNGARLVLQLLHHGSHGQQVLLFGPLLVHAGHKVSRADVVQVVVQNVIACDVAFLVNHRVGVVLAVVENVLPAVAQVGVEHTFQLDAHHIRPLGLVGEVEQVALGHALHLRVRQPLRVVLVGFLLQH